MNVRPSTTLTGEILTDKALASQWNTINWHNVKCYVNRLQTRIAKATQENKLNLVKRLQYLLTHSHYAKLLAVRTVTQNRGKRTPGVDGVRWGTACNKMQAALTLTDKHYTAQPLKRVYIPKPGKATKRPLSIPTMYDRAMQALYTLALQPTAETLADTRSFGFRLFRSAQDASQYAFICLANKNAAQWILEGDIKGCFDNISHEWLRNNVPMDTSILNQFLKAGYIYDNQLFPTEQGTPQGGIISPLLANMTLDGIEVILSEKYPNMKVHLIRYADDFIVTAPDRVTAEEIKETIRAFLTERGLGLSESKTAITAINDGFNFLGWNFRKYHGKLLIKPSKSSVDKIIEKLRDIIHQAAAWSQERLIEKLNPAIRGWSRYHRHVTSYATFHKLDAILWNMLWRWAKRRHSQKGNIWIAQKYWHSERRRNWVFMTDINRMCLFSDTKIRRHSIPKLGLNPFLDREYFIERQGRMKDSCSPKQTNSISLLLPDIGL